MTNKQTNNNKQTQSVKVTVNNHINANPKPKRRRSKPKPPPEPPIDDFPVLNTPMRNPAMPNISALPIRNTVYIPPSVQITPDGGAPPIPAYFDRPYTNLVRTMEDMQQSLMSEIDDVRQAIVTQPSVVDINPDPFGSPTETPRVAQQEPQRANSTLTTPSPSVTYEHAPSPFMNQFLLSRELFQDDVGLTTLDAQSPMRQLQEMGVGDAQALTQETETGITKMERRLLKLPEYIRRFNEASASSDKKDRAKHYQKIKKVGKELGLEPRRGRPMEEYVNLVVAEIQRNRL